MSRKLFVAGSAAAVTGIATYKLVKAWQGDGTKRGTGQDWSTADMPDLSGKVMIVTGANSGIGFEAAKAFAAKGAHTILACRNMDKAQVALADIKRDAPQASVEIMALDLASQTSIHTFAEAFKARFDRLDVLANNAGIMMVPYGTTEDGFERQVGTNHLGHFALTGLLIDRLIDTPNSRVVNVSSMGHRFGNVDFDNLLYDDGQDYSPVAAYGRSKLANLLFTYELQRRYDKAGVKALSLAAHPGASSTNLGNHLMDDWYGPLMMPLMLMMSQSAAMGALPTIRAAVDPQAQGAQYYGPGGFLEQNGYPVVVSSNEASHDLADARKLWEVSESLTGVRYGPLDQND